MRSKVLRKLFFALSILTISFPAFAGYQVTSQAGDSAAAEVVAGDPQNTAEFLIIATIGGNAAAVTVELVVNNDAATADFTDDFTLTFPNTCPRDGGLAGEITFDETSTGANTYDIILGGFNAGGGGAVGGSATFTCTVTVNAVDDFIDEDSENMNLTIVTAPSQGNDPLVQAFSIGDNDTAGLVATDTNWNGTDAIVLNQKLTDESGATATFFVELATQPLSDITVDLAVSDAEEALISSGGSGDVSSLELTFTPANWNDGQEVTITGQDDNPPDQDGNVAYTVSVVTTNETDDKYDNLLTGPVNGVNEDNDTSGQLRFTQSSQSGDEGTVMTLVVERINGTSGEVTVDYAISDTSTSSADYNDTTNPGTTLTFGDGVASQNISITLVDDDLWEPTAEEFSVTLSNAQGGAILLNPTTQDITINPSDAIVISVSAPTPDPVPEGDSGDADVPVSFDVTYTGGELESPLTISWMTVDGSALGGADYVSVAATDIDLPINGDPVTISVDVNGDDDPEGNETFSVQLSESHDLVTLAGGGASVATIEDDDASDDGTFSITSITPNPVMESAGLVTVTVSRIGNTVNSAATINFSSSDGTAIEPGDYTAVNSSLVWALDDTDTFKTFDVTINDDEAGESAETFSVTITADTTEAIGINSGDVTIIGDPTVTFSPTSYNVSEDGGSVTVFVTRANVDDEAVAVDYTTTDGSAEAGDDYTTTSGTLNWAAGEEGPMPINIPILADADETGPESFTVDLSSCDNCSILTGQATVTVEEGEVSEPTPGTLAFNPTSYPVSEATGNAGLLVTRTGGTDGDVTIDWITVDGSATSPDDFAASGGTLSWSDGEGGSKLAQVAIVDDSETENTESFTVMLVADSETGTDGLPTVVPTAASVSILDNDNDEPGELSVLSNNVGEGDGIINVTVTRDGGSTGAASVDFATADGTALAGSDYNATNGTLNWADGESASQMIPIQIVDDAVVEGPEIFTVTLSNASGATIADGSANVEIFDNDGGGNFDVSDVTVLELDQEAVVTVTRSNDNDSAAFIFWETSDGTAEDENGDNDYKYASGELVWGEGDTSNTKTITIDIVRDFKDEGNEWFTVSIVGFQGESITISKADGIVTIVDPVSVPTLSQWAMGLLVLLLLGIGAYSLPVRKRYMMVRH